ncbi:MAG: Cytosine-specific methyltransferase [Parcubacteria group bacterium GW2011_GWA1_38_7]|nr:MAG: Cytosine-specific methyltransferase [Parcubacteria group bacterium GW2011_GWA1_38_7]
MNNKPAKNNSKQIYSTYNSLSSSGMSDDIIIRSLVDMLKTNRLGNDLTFATFLSGFYSNGEFDYTSMIELIGLTHQKKKEKVAISNTDERKHNGIYYTNYSIAKRIAEDTLSLYSDSFDPTKLTFLEPCSGTGIFAIAYLDTIFETNKKYLSHSQKILNNMFYADIDEEAISLLKIIIPAYLKSKYTIDIVVPEKNIFIGDALFNTEKGNVGKNDLRVIFNKKSGFDVVLTNPPYKLLKANSNKYGESATYKEQITEILKFIRRNNTYKFNTGTLNLYKLFVEEIIENYTNNNGKIGLLIPSTLLSDKQSFELRSRLLDKYSLFTIYTIPEKNNFFLDISQAFCFFSLDKSKHTDELKLVTNISDSEELNKEPIPISKTEINSISTFKEIVLTDRMGWRILHKIHKNKRLKEIPSITNLRGELDLTLDKKFITNDGTNYCFLRGNGIKEFVFTKDNLFVHNSFINKLNGKARFLSLERLVCQQISNINLTKRLKFSKVPRNVVLGNSCNFIVTNNDTLFQESNISLDYLLGLLNSFLLNWRFQVTSSNNHIGNYELDELPLAIPNLEQKSIVEDLANRLVNDPNNSDFKGKLNSTVFDIYGLSKDEALYILDKHKESEIAKVTEKWLYKT